MSEKQKGVLSTYKEKAEFFFMQKPSRKHFLDYIMSRGTSYTSSQLSKLNPVDTKVDMEDFSYSKDSLGNGKILGIKKSYTELEKETGYSTLELESIIKDFKTRGAILEFSNPENGNLDHIYILHSRLLKML